MLNLLAVIFLLVSAPVFADSFVLDSGTVFFNPSGSFNADAAGGGFSMRFGDVPGPTRFSQSGNVLTIIGEVFPGAAVYQINGAVVPDAAHNPTFPVSGGGHFTLTTLVTVPENFAGNTMLQGVASLLGTVQDLGTALNLTVAGSGLASVQFGLFSGGDRQLQETVTFGTTTGNGAVTAVPEPSTLLLLTSGLMSLWSYRRLRPTR